MSHNKYPQLASVEIRVAGATGERRVDFTQWHSEAEKRQDKEIIYEVKNWTGWDRKTARERAEIRSHLRDQVTYYLNVKDQRFAGVKLQIRGKESLKDDPEIKEIIDELEMTATARRKTFDYGFIE